MEPVDELLSRTESVLIVVHLLQPLAHRLGIEIAPRGDARLLVPFLVIGGSHGLEKVISISRGSSGVSSNRRRGVSINLLVSWYTSKLWGQGGDGRRREVRTRQFKQRQESKSSLVRLGNRRVGILIRSVDLQIGRPCRHRRHATHHQQNAKSKKDVVYQGQRTTCDRTTIDNYLR